VDYQRISGKARSSGRCIPEQVSPYFGVQSGWRKGEGRGSMRCRGVYGPSLHYGSPCGQRCVIEGLHQMKVLMNLIVRDDREKAAHPGYSLHPFASSVISGALI
jgi:hypothetical protein